MTSAAMTKPTVVCAADDAYAMCLAVMTASLIVNNTHPEGLKLFVVDGGISQKHRKMLFEGWAGKSVDVCWLSPDLDHLSHLPVSEHVNRMTYARILLPDTLPADVSRVIYLDCDLIVEEDISTLWEIPFDGYYVMAAQDAAAPFIDSQVALTNFQQVRRWLSAVRPIPNYPELGLEGRSQYFNAGVMVIDLEKWRRHCLPQKLIDCLAKNAEQVLWWDQYALNLILHGRWKVLDPRWNQTPHVFRYPDWQRSPFNQEEFARARAEPFIFHFAAATKPWQFGYYGPFQKRFRDYLGLTNWSGWRPRFNLAEAKHCGLEYLRTIRRHWFPWRRA